MFDTMKIVTVPDPLLREVCEACEPGDPSLKRLAKKMARTMYQNNGCGLAAPQVGVMKRFVVIDCDQSDGRQDPIFLVNPVLVETSGDIVEDEAALGFPSRFPVLNLLLCAISILMVKSGLSKVMVCSAVACSMSLTTLMAVPCSRAACPSTASRHFVITNSPRQRVPNLAKRAFRGIVCG